MPVKVRCPSCDKVLNAPDAARGKAVKCPGCETKIRVPAGDGAGVAAGRAAVAKAKAAGTDTLDFLANVDMSKAVDATANICPKCGADLPENASECPKCGTDPATGQLSEAAKRRRRKGVDPSEFYSVALKNSWEFSKENLRVILRTAMYTFVSVALICGCAFMIVWCDPGPPQNFWLGFLGVATQIVPGWIWYLTVSTISATVYRKNSVRDVNFDFFTCVSLGLQTIAWSIVFFCWMPPAILMYPLAMIHMAMPVKTRGWFWPGMLSVFFRNLGPTLFYWVVVTVLYVTAALIGGMFFVLFGGEIAKYAKEVADFWTAETAAGMPKSDAEFPPIPPVLIAAASTVLLVEIFWFAFALVFTTRIIGLIAYYRRDTLDLVTLIPEKQYVKKEKKVDKYGNPVSNWKLNLLKAVGAIIVAGLAGYFVYSRLFAPSM
jgi:ribosomal protein L40E